MDTGYFYILAIVNGQAGILLYAFILHVHWGAIQMLEGPEILPS